MKKGMILGLLGLALIAGRGTAYDLVPVAVSPGLADGVAVVRQSCPTFSWTSVSWALTYKVVVFESTGKEAPAYELIAAQASPMLLKEVPGKALAWTPSAAEQLANGRSYIWYVGAMMNATLGKWSEGQRFMVMEGPVWSMETKERVLKTLQENGISDAVAKKILQEMNSGYAGSIAASFDLTGGSQSGVLALEGNENTFYGKQAGGSITTGLYNSFFGRSAGYATTSGSHNTFMGYAAGRYNSASDNSFLGYYAGYKNTFGYENTFLGSYAGYFNTIGYDNTFLGYLAGQKNTTGADDTFVGESAGRSNTSGCENTFLGTNAGYSNTISHANTFIGFEAGYGNTGNQNTFVGDMAGNGKNTGQYNAFFGIYAGFNNTSGNRNAFLGRGAGYANTSGSNNTYVGTSAGFNNTIGEKNVFLGQNAGANEMGSNKLYIANSETSSPLIWGDFSLSQLVFYGKVGIQKTGPTHLLDVGTSGAYCNGGAWVAGSSREYKENIETLTSTEALQAFELLEPVKFNYKENKDEQYLGFIAEDVPELVAMKDRKGLNPMDVVAMLTKVVQDLAKVSEEQQKTISELKNKIAKLEDKSRKDK